MTLRQASALALLAQLLALPAATAFAPAAACCSHPLLCATRRSAPAIAADPFDVPRPDAERLVSAKSDDDQKLWLAGIGTVTVVSTALLVSALSLLEGLLPDGWFAAVGNANAVPLGLLFAAIGVAHFTAKEMFIGIVPPKGTWGGLWQVPSPGADELGLSYAEYHTYWTGAAEMGGGLLLAASGVGLVPIAAQRLAAFLLLLLTAAVTPANVYMFTHDAQMGGQAPPMKYPDSHVARGVLQVVLLADFWKLSLH